ncbi:Ldh family oxidoreductase [Paraferrimonas sp. SM1919]|uniref:Ldh family oxidoreductase n=1 Tax=Paraferrimonas sp. SM1919 TaxID=2662263 RepID=UPI0013D298BF|nr:Ldh family oxidoreductase [Paraferrimonas sp. SM1919]
MAAKKTIEFDNDYFHFVVKQGWLHIGGSEAQAQAIADNLLLAGLQGKLYQGLGVIEALTIPFEAGALDPKAEPEIESEGPTWAVYKGNKASGHYVCGLMAETAISKAKQYGMAIVFGHDHYDGGSFTAYTKKAIDAGMYAQSSNNSLPLSAPYGGKDFALSTPPFDAALVGGEEVPIVTSLKLCEGYDADISDAIIEDRDLHAPLLVDPETGELTADARKWGALIPGYGRVADCRAPWTFTNPRLYALNIWNELLCAIINPKGVITSELPPLPTDYLKPGAPSPVGGSYILVIDPSHFGPLEEVQRKSDAFVRALTQSTPRAGFDEVQMPGQKGQQAMRQGATSHLVMDAHWQAYKDFLSRQGLTIEELNQRWLQQVGPQVADSTMQY